VSLSDALAPVSDAEVLARDDVEVGVHPTATSTAMAPLPARKALRSTQVHSGRTLRACAKTARTRSSKCSSGSVS
jgi:hypothetical protein